MKLPSAPYIARLNSGDCDRPTGDILTSQTPTNCFFSGGCAMSIGVQVFESCAFDVAGGAEYDVPVCIQKVHLGVSRVLVARLRQNQRFLDSLVSSSLDPPST